MLSPSGGCGWVVDEGHGPCYIECCVETFAGDPAEQLGKSNVNDPAVFCG